VGCNNILSGYRGWLVEVEIRGDQASKTKQRREHTITLTSRQTNNQTNSGRHKQTNKQRRKQASKQTNKQTNTQANTGTNKQTNTQTHKQANKQTHTHTNTHTCTNIQPDTHINRQQKDRQTEKQWGPTIHKCHVNPVTCCTWPVNERNAVAMT
jgi:hypothetical protein